MSNFQYNRNYDDSSDEEVNPIEAVQIFSATKLLENLNNFKLKHSNNYSLKLNEISNDDLTLSFLIHFIAISGIYSPKVNTKYNELKRNNLTDINDPNEHLDDSLFDLSNIETSNFLVEFLARIRLLIRSDKRRIRKIQRQEKYTCWKICETNVIIKTSFFISIYPPWVGRKNENVMANSERLTYTQYISSLRKNSLNILINKRINIVQDDIKFENDYQKNVFMAFWYTIFGVEVSRNPATLIHINMFLDLIQAGKISWRKLFVYFPMSKSDIVLKAKNLNQLYNEFMPHKHKYDFDNSIDGDLNELIISEALVTKEWLKFKLKGEEINDLSTIENLEKVHKTIQESYNFWNLNY